jgi:hypothetical protein
VVGTGSAVSPVTLCLSAQGLGTTDPTIAPPSTVQSFPSLVGLGFTTVARLGRLFPGVNRTDWPDAPTGVSGHRDSREYPCNGGRGWSIHAEMSRYLFRPVVLRDQNSYARLSCLTHQRCQLRYPGANGRPATHSREGRRRVRLLRAV